MTFSSRILKLCTLNIVLMTSVAGLVGCGGGDGDKIKEEYDRIEDQVSDEYDRIEDSVKAEYQRVEDKLSDDEKSMAEILESIFLPNKFEEDLDDFLDKITPEGGQGGLYVGHFNELNDNNDSDIDIGAIYFDIPKNYGSVNSRISYQQKPCQTNNTLSAEAAIKVDNLVTGTLSGSLDTPEGLDFKYVRDLNIKKPIELSTFAGTFEDDDSGKPWKGSFEYRETLDVYGQTLSSGVEDCEVVYTIAQRSNFQAYPLDYSLGELQLDLVNQTNSTPFLTWTSPSDTAITLVSQINVNEAETGANGYVTNQIIYSNTIGNQPIFSPLTTSTPTNYAFVVQSFDINNNLIGFEAVVADLPLADAQ